MPLALTTSELRLAIPAWGCIILAGVGVVYLLMGTRWQRMLNVLSMTVVGCVVGMIASSWIPLGLPFVVVLGGVLLGVLAAFFRTVSHAVLSAVTLAAILAMLAAMVVGEKGFTSYLALNPSNASYSIRVNGPNFALDPVLAAGLAGMLVGAIVAIGWTRFSWGFISSTQGAAVLLWAAVELIAAWRGVGRPPVAAEFPMTLCACWACLVAVGLLVQRATAGPKDTWDAEDDELAEEEL